jgi:hypothetical protein
MIRTVKEYKEKTGDTNLGKLNFDFKGEIKDHYLIIGTSQNVIIRENEYTGPTNIDHSDMVTIDSTNGTKKMVKYITNPENNVYNQIVKNIDLGLEDNEILNLVKYLGKNS